MARGEPRRMRTGRSLLQPLASMAALTVVAIALVALLLWLGA
jgi:hypothetical protein